MPAAASRAAAAAKAARASGAAFSHPDAGGVPTGAPTDKQGRALFGRHVGGLDDVLDAERHAVDRRRRPAVAPAGRRAVGGCACGGDTVADERSDGGFELLDMRKAAFEKVARRVTAGGKIRSGGKNG